MKISELLLGIEKQDLVLPEFQREYVWSTEQAKQLMVSLLKGYPVGSLLFWKTDTPPELKNIDQLPEKLGTLQVMLDGQQRLTTLYLLLKGKIPPYYSEEDLNSDPRSLFYNLELKDFQYYQSSRMKGDPLWRNVSELFNGDEVNVFEIAKDQSEDESDAFTLAQKLNASLNALQSIEQVDMPAQTVPADAHLDEAIDIFDRVNSQGTKLTDAELALTHITGKWPPARRIMKAKMDELAKVNFFFDLTFMTRALTGVVTKRALFDTIHESPREDLESGWIVVSKILDYLVSVLPNRGSVHSTEDVNTTNVLIPLVAYLAQNECKFPNDEAINNATHWLYAAHSWARYTGQTDQRLEHDVSLVGRERSPWEALRAQIIDQRGRIEIKGSDLEGRGVQHPLFRMMYILSKAHGAVDWANGTPLSATYGKAYYIHRHHIFPKSLLQKSLFDAENHLHRKIINEIANRAFLTAATNWDISNRAPSEYLPEVEDRFPGALTSQFIPMDPNLWELERYEDFLDARRTIIARKANEFMSSLLAQTEPSKELPLAEIIQLGESSGLEFKSTLQWDVVRGEQNKHLRHSVLKTIVAFLNSDGGTLVIGVEDDGNIFGLDSDLKILAGSTDKLLQLLAALVVDQIGAEYSAYINMGLASVDDTDVCVVRVDKGVEPAFLDGVKGKEFYVRVGNTSRALDPEETIRYTSMNWD